MATFWSEAGLEPKRQFRWLLYLAGMPSFIVKTVKKPSFSVSETPHDFLNYKFHYPGRVEWETVDITIVDPVQPDSAASLIKILSAAGYVFPNDYNTDANLSAPKTISKKAFVDALGVKIFFEQLGANSGDQVGESVIERWTLNNPYITSVDFGSLDYSSDDLVDLSMTIRYDWAQLELPNPAGENTWKLNPPSRS